MEHVKKFESKSELIFNEIKDILLEADDLGYKTDVIKIKSTYYDRDISLNCEIYSRYFDSDIEILDMYKLNDVIERLIFFVKRTKGISINSVSIDFDTPDGQLSKIIGWKNLDVNHDTHKYISYLAILKVAIRINI